MYRVYGKYAKKIYFRSVIIIFFSLLSNVTLMLYTVCISKLIGDSIVEGDLSKFYLGIILSVSMAAIQFIMLYVMTLYFKKMKGEITSFIRIKFVSHLFNSEEDYEKGVDDSYYTLTEDTSAITAFYNGFYDCVGSINRFAASLIVGFTISWHLSLIILLLGFLKIGANRYIVSKLEETVEKTIRIRSKLLTEILEVFEANVFFRFFDSMIVGKRFRFLYSQYRPLYKKEGRFTVVLNSLNSFLDLIAIVMLLVTGVLLAFNGQITIGTLVAFLTIQDTLTNPISFVGDFIKSFQYQSVSFDRYMDKIGNCSWAENVKAEMCEENIKEIHIDNVSFSYPDGSNVFSDFNALIKGGEITYIAGESGTGKSTLLKLLVGILQPKLGEILCLGKDSVILNPQVCYIAQNPLFFSGSIMENIALSAVPDADKVKAAITEAQLHDIFPDSEPIQDIMLDAKASNLSTGQKNRLALARAFYHDAPIMIFDETLSSVDNILIPKLLLKLEELSSQGKVVVIVSHRQEWIPDQAKKIVIKHERGN